MTAETRQEFSAFLHESKRSAEKGSKNRRGDYTWDELNAKARGFLEWAGN
jgi:hypothetical protein